MADSASTATALVPSRAQDRERIRERRERVWRLRLEGLSLGAIRDRLAKCNPPFVVDVSQVSRDLAHVRRDARRTFDRTQFDPVGFVVDQIQRFELLYAKAMQNSRRTRNVAERCLCYRTAAHMLEQINALCADAGIVDSRIAMLLRAAMLGEHVERPLNGVELQERFANTIVTPDDLTSAAERSLLYGDWPQAEAAALEATAGANGNGNPRRESGDLTAKQRASQHA